ncbi:MAG: NAD(P)-dependent glycerol-3-phosphate dehydrogenase [Parasporobacterium sp.]|nr:NAD(P)-dependent glycerol-3-phosphate dehydrogenase [Parasporobacterium sp.]
MKKISVLGAGTWGMALARMLSNSGNEVTVWSALPAEVESYDKERRHPNLPGMIIPEAISFTGDISEACKDRDILLFAVPSIFVRGTAAQAAPFIPEGQIMVSVAKGLEQDTNMTMTEIMEDEFEKAGLKGARLVALSGPTHAEEVARDLPSTIVSASEDEEAARFVQDVFMNTNLRVYTNPDIKGVELCGAVKNILALAAGTLAGLGFGDNAKAALITRGIAEMSRLGRAMGCSEQTFTGLAGIGDLIVTATSVHSRNNKAGFLLGQGYTPEEAVKEVGMVVEGINALPGIIQLAEKLNVELPIVQAVDSVVTYGKDPLEAVHILMSRNKKAEVEFVND